MAFLCIWMFIKEYSAARLFATLCSVLGNFVFGETHLSYLAYYFKGSFVNQKQTTPVVSSCFLRNN